MTDGSKKQIKKADLVNYDFAESNEGVDLAPVRASGTTFEPERSNFPHYGEPAAVRSTD